jgi:hypothetical protein
LIGQWHAARTDQNWLEKGQQVGPRMGSSSGHLAHILETGSGTYFRAIQTVNLFNNYGSNQLNPSTCRTQADPPQ